QIRRHPTHRRLVVLGSSPDHHVVLARCVYSLLAAASLSLHITASSPLLTAAASPLINVVSAQHNSEHNTRVQQRWRLVEEGVLKDQELGNVVSDADYTKAIQLTFELRRPQHRLFELFADI
ncbi:hypothetical protein PIB30_062661, partial [Stylosanthes scabra]|nr:hypothetical protein [Stylosanthes scabra]